MSTVHEIEAAIEKLPPAEQEEVARWVEARYLTVPRAACFDDWLKDARGAAIAGTTTGQSMAQTRGEE